MGWTDLIDIPKIVGRVYGMLFFDKQGRHRDRVLIMVISLVLSILIYNLGVDLIDPSRNIFLRTGHWLAGTHYTFYSASPGGFYHQIGEYVSTKPHPDGARIKPGESAGSIENIPLVLTEPRSLALVQEDYLLTEDISPKDMEIVAPLYEERLHVLYRKALYQQIRESYSDSEDLPDGPILSLNPDPVTREFFRRSRIRPGTSKPAAGYVPLPLHIINICRLHPLEEQYISILDARDRLKDGDLDVLFATAGAPLESIERLLEDHESFGLMPIDLKLIRELNETLGRNYQPASFSGLYHISHHQVTTLGVRAMLVASRDVPDSVIRGVGEQLNLMKSVAPPLRDFSFKVRFANKYRGRLRETLETWTASLLFIGLVAVAIAAKLTWVASALKQFCYFRGLRSIARDHLEGHPGVEARGDEGKVVNALGNETVVRSLLQGVSQLDVLAGRIRDDYETGGITTTHQRHLIESVDSTRTVFQDNLARSVDQIIETSQPISANLFRELCAKAKLIRGDYRDLQNLVSTEDSRHPLHVTSYS